jgi:uncharacterized protein
MKKIILVSMILAVTTFNAFSQTKHESIKELFSLMKTESMFDKLMIPFQNLQKDSVSKGVTGSLMNSIKPMFKKIMDEDMVGIYDRYYTQQEIKDLIRFYKTKTGQKLINSAPDIQNELMSIVQAKYLGEFLKDPIFKPENITISTKPKHVADSAFIAQMKNEYLDMNISNLQNATAEQKLIFKKAIDRMDPYVKYENKTFHFTITKASEVNMSEPLFELMKKVILNTNSMIKDLNVVPDKNDSTVMRGIPEKSN